MLPPKDILMIIYQWDLVQTVMETSIRLVCILGNEVVQNSYRGSSNVKRHFETKDSEHKGKPLSFFQHVSKTNRQ
jgi:hypothetical protein